MGVFDDFLETADNEGFLKQFFTIDLMEDGFVLANGDESVFEEIEWKAVKKVKFSLDKQTVEIILSNGKNLEIHPDYSNYAQFLKSVPENHPEFDRTIVNGFYANLTGCKVCGQIAVHDEMCEHCGNGLYDPELDEEEFGNPDGYYKQMQLEYFEDMVEPENSAFFEKDPSWKALITNEELDEFNEPL